MDNLQQDLYNLVTKELNEMAWQTGYPLNREVGLDCYLGAFRDQGITTDIRNGEASFFLTSGIGGSPTEFNATLTNDQISRGWNNHPLGSIKSLYNSVYLVFDRMGEARFPRDDRSKSNIEKRNEFSMIRESVPREIRQRMEERFLKYFNDHQEHLFIPASGNIPNLVKPRLVYQTMDTFPIGMIEIASQTESRHGPTEETLFDEGWMDLGLEPGNYYPSESSLIDLFLGKYFHRLSQTNRYNTWSKDQSERDFVVQREKAFAGSHVIKWPNSLAPRR
jgi:hypothetical protein